MNSRYQLARIRSRGESLGPCPDITFNPEERASDIAPTSHSTPRRGPLSPFSPRLPLDTAQQGSYTVMISPRSKYSPISVGAVMDSGSYLGMSIPTIKHNNLNSYKKRSQHANRADPKNPHHQLQRYRVLIHLEILGERGGRKKFVNTRILY